MRKKKATIEKALTWDYTSSDESDVSEDENGSYFLDLRAIVSAAFLASLKHGGLQK